MRIANRDESNTTAMAARIACVAVCLLAASPAIAQDQRTGVSHPDPAVIAASPDDSASPSAAPAKPSAAVPASAPAEVYGPYVPYRQPGNGETKSFDPDAAIVTSTTAGSDERHPLAAPASKSDNDGIVTHVPSRPGEIPEGSLMKVTLREDVVDADHQAGHEVHRRGDRAGDARRRGGGAGGLHPGRTRDLGARRQANRRTGAVIGGVPGALIGAGVGAGAGTVVWLKQDRQAELPKDLVVVFSLTEPMSITPASAAVVPLKSGTPGGE
jgi:hypothetical protein